MCWFLESFLHLGPHLLWNSQSTNQLEALIRPGSLNCLGSEPEFSIWCVPKLPAGCLDAVWPRAGELLKVRLRADPFPKQAGQGVAAAAVRQAGHPSSQATPFSPCTPAIIFIYQTDSGFYIGR